MVHFSLGLAGFACNIFPVMHRSKVRVMAAVISREDRVLVCRRPLHKKHGGLWEFPGGKCEHGESDADAITRELQEELAVSVIAVGPAWGVIEDQLSGFVIVFAPVCIEGEPECLEHVEIRWVGLDELGKMTLAPSDRAFVQDWLSPGIP
jgi:8-oxo-dGTP diphosphatase